MIKAPFKIWSIEGNTQRLDGGSMFGNVPRALWSRWITPDDHHRIPLACRCLLVQDQQGKNILFETGIGAFFEPKMKDRFGVLEDEHVLLRSLADIGFSDEDIDIIVLSHLHFDHAGGLLTAYKDGETPSLLFPNAQILVGKDHWARAKNPHPRDRASFLPVLHDLLEQSSRLKLVEKNHHPLLGKAVNFYYSQGHTAGLMISTIHSGGNSLIYCTDLIPGRAWVHLPVTMGYDRYPEKLIDEKSPLLEKAYQDQSWLFFTHDSDCASAKLSKNDKGKFICHDEKQHIVALTL